MTTNPASPIGPSGMPRFSRATAITMLAVLATGLIVIFSIRHISIELHTPTVKAENQRRGYWQQEEAAARQAAAREEANRNCIVGGLILLHLMVLWFTPRLTVSRARWLVAAGILGGSAILLFLSASLHDSTDREMNSFTVTVISLIIFSYIGLRPIIAFSMPCRILSAAPLLAVYFVLLSGAGTVSVIALAVVMAGFYFPLHRRLGEYWRPRRLPRLPRLRASRDGVTLIELLVVIAIIAISAAGIANLTSQSHKGLMMQHDWRDALALAEDEIALLRAAPEAPAIGRYGAHERLADRPFAKDTVVEIKPGPTERLREARVTVHIRVEYGARDVTLAALIENGGK